MFEIGELLKNTRESSGLSLKEVSEDLKIKEVMLDNIESGNTGCFKDIFELKEDVLSYTKYLGLNTENMLDSFNEYMFEHTSRIPIKEIEKQVMEQNKEKQEEKVVSPYSKPMKKYPVKYYVTLYIVAILVVIFILVWCVYQIAMNRFIDDHYQVALEGVAYEYSK